MKLHPVLGVAGALMVNFPSAAEVESNGSLDEITFTKVKVASLEDINHFNHTCLNRASSMASRNGPQILFMFVSYT